MLLITYSWLEAQGWLSDKNITYLWKGLDKEIMSSMIDGHACDEKGTRLDLHDTTWISVIFNSDMYT